MSAPWSGSKCDKCGVVVGLDIVMAPNGWQYCRACVPTPETPRMTAEDVTDVELKMLAAEGRQEKRFWRSILATYHALAASQQNVEWWKGHHARLMDEANAQLDALRASLALAQADSKRLDWLETKANGYPVEIDAFTGLKDPATDAVFVTHYPPTGEEVPDAQNVIHPKPHRLGQGRTLREALDSASRPSETTQGEHNGQA